MQSPDLRHRALVDAGKLLHAQQTDEQKAALGRIQLELWRGPYYLVEGEDEPLRWEELFGRNVPSKNYFGSEMWDRDCELVRGAFPDEVFFDFDCGQLTVDPESVDWLAGARETLESDDDEAIAAQAESDYSAACESTVRIGRREVLGATADYL